MNDSSLILDTHVWIWWVKQDQELNEAIATQLSEGAAPLAISSASIYEAVRLIERGRVAIDLPWSEWLHAATVESDIAVISVSAEIASRAAALPMHHGDPLDRFIIATALCLDALLASVDHEFPQYEELTGRLITGKD